MLLSRHQNAEQNHDMKIGSRCFENGAQFRYLSPAVIRGYLPSPSLRVPSDRLARAFIAFPYLYIIQLPSSSLHFKGGMFLY
jgi:hypothetical protein